MMIMKVIVETRIVAFPADEFGSWDNQLFHTAPWKRHNPRTVYIVSHGSGSRNFVCRNVIKSIAKYIVDMENAIVPPAENE